MQGQEWTLIPDIVKAWNNIITDEKGIPGGEGKVCAVQIPNFNAIILSRDCVRGYSSRHARVFLGGPPTSIVECGESSRCIRYCKADAREVVMRKLASIL